MPLVLAQSTLSLMTQLNCSSILLIHQMLVSITVKLLILLDHQLQQSLFKYKVNLLQTHNFWWKYNYFAFILVPPTIITFPTSNVLVRYKNTTQLNCSVSGVPRPLITWLKDGVEIPTEQYSISYLSAFHVLSELQIEGSLTSTGNYTCQGVNELAERKVISRTVDVLTYGKITR